MTSAELRLLRLAALVMLYAAASYAAASPGCGLAPPASGRLTFTHESVEREVYLHLPASYAPNTASSVAFSFHGWGGSGNDFMDGATTAAADERGTILVSPTGIDKSWNFRGSSTGVSPAGPVCNVQKKTDVDCKAPCDCANLNICVWTHCGDDVAFFKALLLHVQSLLCIDSTKVFAWGVSNGGMFTWELGQNAETASLLSAIAPVVGLPHGGFLDGKGSAAPLPVLLLTGLTDDLVLPGGRDEAFTESPNSHDYHVTASAITKKWAQGEGCSVSGTPQRLLVPGVDASETECTSFCTAAFPPVVDCRFNGGHILPTWGPKAIFGFFARQTPTPILTANDPRVVYTGRVLVPGARNLPARFAWPLTQMACSFRGVAIAAELKGPVSEGARMRVMVDGKFTRYVEILKNKRDVFVLAAGLEDIDHVVSLWRVTEDDPFDSKDGTMEFYKFQLPASSKPQARDCGRLRRHLGARRPAVRRRRGMGGRGPGQLRQSDQWRRQRGLVPKICRVCRE
jgi:polyhydroxybutyrate depolymerase